MGKQLYIHYGADHFDPDRFNIRNRNPAWVKPLGGFWASRIDTRYGWKQFCDTNDLWNTSADKIPSFIFSLKDTANIVTINTLEDLHALPECKDLEGFSMGEYYIDFEKCKANGIDAIDIPDINADREQIKWALCCWDCDCILILNPEIIKEEVYECGRKQRSAEQSS